MHLSKFFETFSLRTSFTPKFTELIEKGSESILKGKPLANIISRIENNITKHVDISSPTIKPFTFAGSELLTKAETWILIIYYYLHKYKKHQETFLILLQQVNMYRVSGKHKLKRYVYKCCKELFTKSEAICVINSNPLFTKKLKASDSVEEVAKKFKYFLVNPSFFEEHTSDTQLNVLSNGVYYYEKKRRKYKEDTKDSDDKKDDEGDEGDDSEEEEEMRNYKELERKRKKKESMKILSTKLKKKLKKQKTVRLRKDMKRRNRNKNKSKSLRKRSIDQNIEMECIDIQNTTTTTPNPNSENQIDKTDQTDIITALAQPVQTVPITPFANPCSITHIELTI